MEIDQNQLLNNERGISSEFVGPIRILPSTLDNYGADYQIFLFTLSHHFITRDKCEINQCIVLNPSPNEYDLFTIDLINLPTNENNKIHNYR